MGRKLNVSHLSEEECEKILHVLQKDFEVRQAEKERIGVIQSEVKTEQNKAQALTQKRQFNKNCCIRCYQVFGLIFNRRRQCYHCGYNVCKDCCDYHPDGKVYICHTCEKERDLAKQSCNWFYTTVGQKFRRFGSAKVVRSLYKSSSYCKLRHVVTQGGLNSNRLIIITNKDNNNNKAHKANNRPDTELDGGYTGPRDSRSVSLTGRKNARRPLPEAFCRSSDGNDDDNGDGGDDDKDTEELPSPSPAASSRPHSTTITRTLGPHPAARAGSLDTLNLLSSTTLSSSSPASSTSTSKRHKSRTADSSKSRQDLGKSRTPDPGGARARWEDVCGSGRKVKTGARDDIYKHAFESARQAEEHKFKAKFDVLLNNLHQTLDRQSPQGLTDSFASTSYGEVMLSFRGRVKDLLVGFTQRLQLAYESFDNVDSPEDHGQRVKQNVSRLLEDLLGEALDLTSDEAVSDLSSLSDDSGNDRHAFEDQLAQAVVSKILDNHRREVHHSLHEDRHSRHLTSPPLVPVALNDDDDDENVEDEKRSSTTENKTNVKDTDISKDFEDLRNFVQNTQSRSWQLDENCPAEDSADGVAEECGAPGGSEGSGVGSSLVTPSKERDFPPLPDFSQFEQIDFNSGEVDPDLLQMNLAAIPEETEEQLVEAEDEAADTHWRENWIFKGQAPSVYSLNETKRFRPDCDQPQYVMVPQPDEDLAPRIGNTDVHQLSDLSDNEELTDDDNSFYPRTSEELARISRHQRPTPSPPLSSPSLIPSVDPSEETDPVLEDSKHAPLPSSLASKVGAKVEDVSVGTEEDEPVGSLVEKAHQQPKELKLLEDLVPAEGDDPQFSLPPESVIIQEGEPVKVVCRVSGTQPIDVFWYREQQTVEELEEGEDVDLETDGERRQVTLYNLSKHQAGQYMCIALSDLGKAIKYFTVTVKDNKQELKKPEFLKELKDVEVLEGQSVKFRCKVKGYPQPRVNWYKDGKLLRSNRSCRIEKFGNRDYILTMDYATMDDDAEYMVVARNVAGGVRSTAQVIVEPYAEGHPLLLKSRSQSMSTVYTDPESDRPSFSQMDDFMGALPTPADRERGGYLSPQDDQMDSLESKVGSTRDSMRQEAEHMLDTADELTAVSHHLEDMERHLDCLEGHNSSRSVSNTHGRGRSTNRTNRFSSIDDETALEMFANEKAMGEATRNIRKLTSNALSVLRAAEEIIQSEKSLSFAPSQQGVCSSPVPDLPEDSHSRSESLSSALSSAMDQSCLTSHSDLNQSVSSGYGTLSMTSSALEDNCNDDTITESLLSQLDQDDFALCLPSLDDPTPSSGPYREEVAMNVASSKPSGPPSSSSSSTLTDSSASSYATVRARKAASPLNTSTHSSLSERAASARAEKSSTRRSVGEEEEESLRPNFGPKEISRTAYGRDYVVGSCSEEGEGSERKRWSVSLNPHVPTADVVNRQPSLEETEEQIYLTAGKTFQLEDRVRELQARVDGDKGRGSNASSLAQLEDQVAHTAARVVRNEKEVSSLERAVHTLQFSPRSSRGLSSSSASSTPRESIDSGVVSTFAQERPLSGSLPPPPAAVQLVGHTLEGEVPESCAEFDADSGVELPSVTRLRVMFGSRSKEEEEQGTFKRVHSITARSLTKSQLQQLREAGNTALPHDIMRVTDSPVQSKAFLRLQKADSGVEVPGSITSSPPLGVGSAPQSQPAVKKIKTSDLSQPALYKDLDPSNLPVLIYPETETKTSPQKSAAVSGSAAAAEPEPSVAVPPSTSSPLAAVSPARSLSPSAVVALPEGQGVVPTPKIRSGCISARAAFWERRIMQGEATDVDVEEEFPEMVQGGEA